MTRGLRSVWDALVRIMRPREERVTSVSSGMRKECPCAALVRSHLFVRVPDRDLPFFRHDRVVHTCVCGAAFCRPNGIAS